MVETVKAVGRAIYARLSQDRGKLSENVDIQIEEAREYFAGQGWPVDERLIFGGHLRIEDARALDLITAGEADGVRKPPGVASAPTTP